jgi:hypothetical protein
MIPYDLVMKLHKVYPGVNILYLTGSDKLSDLKIYDNVNEFIEKLMYVW